MRTYRTHFSFTASEGKLLSLASSSVSLSSRSTFLSSSDVSSSRTPSSSVLSKHSPSPLSSEELPSSSSSSLDVDSYLGDPTLKSHFMTGCFSALLRSQCQPPDKFRVQVRCSLTHPPFRIPTNCRLFLLVVRLSSELLPSFLFIMDFSMPAARKEADGANNS